jgi:hypothetical protein
MKPVGQRAIESIGELVRQVRLVDGWLTDAGVNVLLSPVSAELGDEGYSLALVYALDEVVTGYQGGPAVAATQRMEIELPIVVDVLMPSQPGRESVQFHRIAYDLRRALSPKNGELCDDIGVIGQIEHGGASAILDATEAGAVGCQTRVTIRYIEQWRN